VPARTWGVRSWAPGARTTSPAGDSRAAGGECKRLDGKTAVGRTGWFLYNKVPGKERNSSRRKCDDVPDYLTRCPQRPAEERLSGTGAPLEGSARAGLLHDGDGAVSGLPADHRPGPGGGPAPAARA